MTVAIVFSRALAGVHAPLVTVEAHLAGGLPAFNLVGLPETEVKESRDRDRAAFPGSCPVATRMPTAIGNSKRPDFLP